MITNTLLHGKLQLPANISQGSSVDQLHNCLYLYLLLNKTLTIPSSLTARVILAFGNHTMKDFNHVLLRSMPGEEHMFETINHVNVPEDEAAGEPFAVEYLPSIFLGSIPSSCLPPKIGPPLILIQNLSPIEGLCNGTRMRPLEIWLTCLQVAILGGCFDCMIRLLPRI